MSSFFGWEFIFPTQTFLKGVLKIISKGVEDSTILSTNPEK